MTDSVTFNRKQIAQYYADRQAWRDARIMREMMQHSSARNIVTAKVRSICGTEHELDSRAVY